MNIENLDITLEQLKPYFDETVYNNMVEGEFILTTNEYSLYLNKTLKGKFRLLKERIKKVIEDVLFINNANNPLTCLLYKSIHAKYQTINQPKSLIVTCEHNNVSALQFLKEIENFKLNKIVAVKIKLSNYCKNTIDIIAEHFSFSAIKSYAVKLLLIQYFFLNINKKVEIKIKNKRVVYTKPCQQYALILPHSADNDYGLPIMHIKQCHAIIAESYRHCIKIKNIINNKKAWTIQLSRLMMLVGKE